MTRSEQDHIAEILQAALLALRYCVATVSGSPACDCGRYVWDAAQKCWLCHTGGGGYIESDEQTCVKCKCNMTRDGRVWQPGVMQLPELGDRIFTMLKQTTQVMSPRPRCLGDLLDDMEDVAGAEVAPHVDTSMAGVG